MERGGETMTRRKETRTVLGSCRGFADGLALGGVAASAAAAPPPCAATGGGFRIGIAFARTIRPSTASYTVSAVSV